MMHYQVTSTKQHLTLAELLDGNYSGTLSGGAAIAGVNMPPSEYDNSGWQFESADVYQAGTANYLMLGKQLNQYLDSGAIAPKDAFSIDKKFDDGAPDR